jgi:hydrogenase maturation protease
VLVIGFGNPDRGDDAAGPLVARLLAGRIAARVLERHGDALALLDAWDGAPALVLVDAAAPMDAPGRLHRFDIAAQDLPRDLAFGSTHAFGLPEAVALARRLGRLPAHAVVYAIEGACFDAGAPVSPAVAAAVEAVAAHIAAGQSGEGSKARGSAPGPRQGPLGPWWGSRGQSPIGTKISSDLGN